MLVSNCFLYMKIDHISAIDYTVKSESYPNCRIRVRKSICDGSLSLEKQAVADWRKLSELLFGNYP